jgi:hypothetical protein
LRTDPTDVGDDTTGLTITFSDSADDSQQALKVLDKDGTSLIMEVLPKSMNIIDRRVGATSGVFVHSTGINGTTTPPCLEFSDGIRIYGGVGDPSSTFIGTGRAGDIFLRTDTPSTTGQRYYVCTVAGTPGTWSGLA